MSNLIKLSSVLNVLVMVLSIVLFVMLGDSVWIATSAFLMFISNMLLFFTNMRDYEKR